MRVVVVVGQEADVAPGAMSHEEIAGNLAAYAAGSLDAVRLRIVQGHLAAGCQTCLTQVFDAPVGRPRPALPAETSRGRWTSAFAIMAMLAVVVAVGVATTLVARERQAAGGVRLRAGHAGESQRVERCRRAARRGRSARTRGARRRSGRAVL